MTRDLGTRVSDMGTRVSDMGTRVSDMMQTRVTRDKRDTRERDPDKSLQSRVMTEMRQHLIR